MCLSKWLYLESASSGSALVIFYAKNTHSLESREISDRRWDLCCFRTQFLHQFQRTPEGLVKAQKGFLYWKDTKKGELYTPALDCVGLMLLIKWKTVTEAQNHNWTSSTTTSFYLWGHVWGSAPWRQRTAGGVGSPSPEFVRSSKLTRSNLWYSAWPCSAGWPSPWSWGLAELQEISVTSFHHTISTRFLTAICFLMLCWWQHLPG